MYEGRRRARRVVWFTAGVAGLALAAAATVAAWPQEPPEPPPPWRSPAPQHAMPALTAAGSGSSGQGGSAGASSADLSGRLGPLLDDSSLGSPVSAAVVDAGGRSRYERASDEALIPASALKIVTSAGVLAELGPDARFATTAVRGASRDEVVLVGGGDPTLTRDARGGGSDPDRSYGQPARLPDLAGATADRLRRDGVRRVSVSVDDSWFTGPTEHPTWPSDYVSFGSVAPVTALSVDGGRVDPDAYDDAREPDPSLAAGRLFADMLAARGVDVVGDVGRASAPKRAAKLGEVLSPRLEEIVETTLATSDNDMAEVLLRQTAVAAGRPGSFDGGVRATVAALDRLGVDTAGLDMSDGSGLSRANRVSASTLAQVLSAAASPRHPELRPVVTGLPVAGFNGTLHYRFADADANEAVGLVRAKTGTLTGVSSLAGIAYDRTGRVLVFAVLANGVGDPLAAEAQLDRVAAALATPP